MRTRTGILLLAVLICLLGAIPRVALAQTNALDAERFKPAVTYDGFIQTESSSVRPSEDRWAFGLFANYARNTLIAVDGNGDLAAQYISGRLGFDVMASLTVAGPFAIGLDLPFFVVQTGDADPDFAGLGDVRLVPKLRILDDRSTVGLGITAELRAPTHLGDYSGGARNVVFAPKIVFDHRFVPSGLRVGANAGFAFRERTQFVNIIAGHEFAYLAALGYRFGGAQDGPVEIGGELVGGVGLVQTDKEEVPLEGFLYGKIYPNDEWEIDFGPGIGMVPGYGVPTIRVFAGVRWTPTSHDKDHDGVSDEDDKCPDQAEDRDGDEDEDGCPEEPKDDDHDGVPNADDECPTEKETINGVDDDDGCPDGGDVHVILREGKIEILDNVQFRTGSAEIDPQSHSLLNQVALTLKAHPEVKKVRVEGHTDDTGPHDANVTLSKARAESVRTYLVGKGVRGDRLRAEGYGPDKPLVDKKDPQSRAKNRRVEFNLEQ